MDMIVERTSAQLEGMEQQFRTTTHNLANVSTTGYKRHLTTFANALAQQMGTTSRGGAGGSPIASTQIDFSQGPIRRTENPLDVAVRGDGFFVLDTPDGPRYTRDGSFRVSATGQLATSDGQLVAGENGPIVIPAWVATSQVTISQDGRVSAEGLPLGQLRLVDFEDRTALVPLGAGRFVAPEDVKPLNASGEIHQGHVEDSNVRAVDEMVNLVVLSRTYGMGMKSARMQDERVRSLLQVAMS